MNNRDKRRKAKRRKTQQLDAIQDGLERQRVEVEAARQLQMQEETERRNARLDVFTAVTE